MKDQINKAQYLLGIGSNINPEKNLIQAIRLIAEHVTIIKRSSIWQTPAVGSQGPDYLNAAILIESSYMLEELKHQILLRIENELGRVRSKDKNADRTIDLDVIIDNGSCIDEDLWSQAHVAVPASEILPDLINPDTEQSLSQIAQSFLSNNSFLVRFDLDLKDLSP